VDASDPRQGPAKRRADPGRRGQKGDSPDGASLVIISDRDGRRERVPIPALLAVSAVHHGLIERGLRGEAGLIVESGEPARCMHFCLLCGYGANGVNPYMAFECSTTAAERRTAGETWSRRRSPTTTSPRSRRASSRR
jgi:hypothetical protein